MRAETETTLASPLQDNGTKRKRNKERRESGWSAVQLLVFMCALAGCRSVCTSALSRRSTRHTLSHSYLLGTTPTPTKATPEARQDTRTRAIERSMSNRVNVTLLRTQGRRTHQPKKTAEAQGDFRGSAETAKTDPHTLIHALVRTPSPQRSAREAQARERSV